MAGRMGSKLQSTAAIGLAKLFLSIFNIIFIASGVALMLLGAYMHIELYRFVSISTFYYDSVSLIMIGIGFGILLIGCLGFLCTIKGHGKMLYLFSVMLVLVFLIEMATAVAAFVSKKHIENGFSEGLTIAMRSYGSDVEKHYAIDGIQIRFKCCGINSYDDWLNSTLTGEDRSEVPLSCCEEVECRVGQTKNPSLFHRQGCFRKLSTFMQSNFVMIGVVAVAFALFQLVGALLSCCLAKNINKAKYEQVD